MWINFFKETLTYSLQLCFNRSQFEASSFLMKVEWANQCSLEQPMRMKEPERDEGLWSCVLLRNWLWNTTEHLDLIKVWHHILFLHNQDEGS